MRTWRLATLAAGLAVVMTGTGFSADTVRVFRYDGSLQCGMGQAVPLDDMAKELTAVNIRVLSQREASRVGFHHRPVWRPDRHRERLRDREG